MAEFSRHLLECKKNPKKHVRAIENTEFSCQLRKEKKPYPKEFTSAHHNPQQDTIKKPALDKNIRHIVIFN